MTEFISTFILAYVAFTSAFEVPRYQTTVWCSIPFTRFVLSVTGGGAAEEGDDEREDAARLGRTDSVLLHSAVKHRSAASPHAVVLVTTRRLVFTEWWD